MKNPNIYWSRTKYFRPFVIISFLLILFGSTFIPLHTITNNGAFLLSIIFPVIAGWLLGLRLGLLFWFLHSLVLMFLAQAVGSGLEQFISSGIFSYIITLLLTCGVGRISDLTKKLTTELQERQRIELELRQFKETLEKQVEERTASLARINEDLQKEILQKEKANDENLNLQNSLKRAEKMEAIGQLAGGVAHDFNNMLGVIIGYTEMLLEQMHPSQKFFTELEEIQKAARRSADLTRQLLTFARKQTVAPRVLDLNQTIEGIFNMLRRLIGENVSLVWMPDSGLWPINMDPSQIDQILANLCVNARDAIAGVGTLKVETKNVTFDQEYCAAHAGSLPGEYVSITVSDSGCGMDKETLAHIFEPFFTTKHVGEGTGLGLATVYGAVKQNNGFIDVCSEPGKGTTFTICIPRHVETTTETWATASAEPVASGGEIVMLVEDEPTLLKMSKTMLERLGYTVVAAGTPSEAIRLVRERQGRIDLLMTDVIMPEMNGRDLAGSIMSISPDVKLLFMSGYTANVIAHHGVLDQGVHFIQKPFSRKDLGRRLREVLEG